MGSWIQTTCSYVINSSSSRIPRKLTKPVGLIYLYLRSYPGTLYVPSIAKAMIFNQQQQNYNKQGGIFDLNITEDVSDQIGDLRKSS